MAIEVQLAVISVDLRQRWCHYNMCNRIFHSISSLCMVVSEIAFDQHVSLKPQSRLLVRFNVFI